MMDTEKDTMYCLLCQFVDRAELIYTDNDVVDISLDAETYNAIHKFVRESH